jgi:hypothetical protein
MGPDIDRPGPGRRGTTDVRVLRQQAGDWPGSILVSVALTARLFLLSQGVEPRGILAAGWATSETYEGPHREPGVYGPVMTTTSAGRSTPRNSGR